MVKENRIATGVPGFDSMSQGGFEIGSNVVIAGPSGSGKTIFAGQFIHNGITKYKENGIYISLEETKKSINSHFMKFGWDFVSLEKKGKLKVLHYPPNQIEKLIKDAPYISDLIEEHKIKRVVIDSATSLLLLQENDYKRRESFLKLLDIIKNWGCTTLLTSEAERTNSGVIKTKFDIEYLVDGLIAIHPIRKGDLRDKALEIIKLRGTNHSNRTVPLKITNKGIQLFPNQTVFGD